MDEAIVSALLESKNFWSVVIGTAFGAVVGSLTAGVIAWWLQRQNLREARKMREEEKLERDKALGKSVFMKMIHVQTVFFHMHNYFQERINLAKTEGNSDISAYTQALANMPAPVEFTYEELGFLTGAANNELFNLIWPMNQRLQDLLSIVVSFNAKRMEFENQFRHFIESAEGMEARLKVPEILRAQFELKKSELNGFIEVIHPMAEGGVEDARKARNDLEKMLNSVLELGVRFEETDSQTSEKTPQQTSG